MKNDQFTQGFRLVGAIAWKDIVDALKNKTILGILIGVSFMMLSSQVLTLLTRGQTEPSAIAFDTGQSMAIRTIVRSRELRLGLTTSFDEMASVVSQSAEPRLGLVLPADFDTTATAGGPIEVPGYFSHWVKPDQVADLVLYFEAQLGERVGVPIRIVTPAENQLYPAGDEYGFNTMVASGIVLGVMTIGLLMVPILLIEEKETHTLAALLLSPARLHHLLIGKALAGLSYAIAASAVIFIFSSYWIVHWWVALIAVVLGALCAVMTGLLIGSIFEQVTTVNLWVGLIIAFFLLPVFLWASLAPKLPPAIQTLAQFLPSLAMSELMHLSMTESVSFGQVIPQIGVMVVFILLMFGLITARLRQMDR